MGNPNQTKTGKPRLNGLSIAQLEKMLETSSRPKDKAKIRNALARRVKTQAVSTKVVAEPVAEAV